MITGKTLIDLGYAPGQWFAQAIAAAEAVRAGGGDEAAVRAEIDRHAPPPTLPLRRDPRPFHLNIQAKQPGDSENIAKVADHMAELMRVLTVEAGAVMPDVCPSDARPGTIPVGGVIAARGAIHPGMHSADICCRVAITMFDGGDATALLDAGMKLSHFGPGGRPWDAQWQPPVDVSEAMAANRFLRDAPSVALEHFGTQGDGNHFFYVGRVASTGWPSSRTTDRASRGPCSTRPA